MKKIVFKELSKVDLSIINDTDWFTVVTLIYNENITWIVKGNIISKNIKDSIRYCINTDNIYKGNSYLTHESYIKSIRLSTKEEIDLVKSKYPKLFQKKWDDFGTVDGYYIDYSSNVRKIYINACKYNRNIIPTEKEANAILALMQLIQWRDKANGQKLEEWCDWNSAAQIKYCIYKFKNNIDRNNYIYYNCILAFKTEEIRDQFMIDHKNLIEEAKILL